MRYEIKEGILFIQDEELGLDVKELFLLPSLQDTTNCLEKENHRWLEKKGVVHGEYQILHPNQTLMSSCYYLEGRLHGPSRFYSEEGKLLSESWYLHGKKEGRTRRYFLSSALSAVEKWKEGKMHLDQNYFYEDGKTRAHLIYQMGKLDGKACYYYPNGSLQREVTLKEGKKHGWEKIFDREGTLLDEGEYHIGVPIGIHRRWHRDGKVAEVREYQADGSWNKKIWDEEGTLQLEEELLPSSGEFRRRERGPDGTMEEKKREIESHVFL